VLYYYIQPLCGQDLALSVDQGNAAGDLFVYTKGAGDDRQLWTPVELIDDDSEANGLLLLNKQSGLAAMSPEQPGDNAFVAQVTLDDAGPNVERATWELDPNTVQIAGKTVACAAIRTTGDKSRNLNVRQGQNGCATDTQVIVFEWGANGHPQLNEVWTFEAVLP
jgi:hypothetical protein